MDQYGISRERLRSSRLDEVQVDVLLQVPLKIEELSKNNAKYAFVLEAAIRAENTVDLDVSRVLKFLMTELQDVHWNSSESYYYYFLRALRELLLFQLQKNELQQSAAPAIIATLATHSDPECPWGSVWGSEIVNDTVATLDIFVSTNIPQFIKEKVAPACSQLTKLEKHARSTRKQAISGNLRPHLGFGSGIGATQSEESIRDQWYNSNDVAAVSMIWFLIGYLKGDLLEANWLVITSFILNLTDDTKVDFKLVSCRLVIHFLDSIGAEFLKKKGLLDPFVKSINPNLNYLPSLTPTGDSLRLLPPSYFAVSRLLQHSDHSRQDLLALVSSKLLFSIGHVKGNRDASSVLEFLIRQLSTTITEYVKEDVLALLSRINFVLSQIIIDPNEQDPKIVIAGLETQKSILELFLNSTAANLVFEYRLDFVGAWAVLLRRSITSEYVVLVKANMELLSQYATVLALEQQWQLELGKIKPHTSQQLQNIITQQMES